MRPMTSMDISATSGTCINLSLLSNDIVSTLPLSLSSKYTSMSEEHDGFSAFWNEATYVRFKYVVPHFSANFVQSVSRIKDHSIRR